MTARKHHTRSPLGRYIVARREKRGWDRADLSRQSGVPVSTLKNIENNPKTVKSEERTLKNLAEALETDYAILRLLAKYDDPPHLGIDEQNNTLLTILKSRPDGEEIRDLILRMTEEQRDVAFELLKLQSKMMPQ